MPVAAIGQGLGGIETDARGCAGDDNGFLSHDA
jgi:hypothetical protein